MTTWTGDELGTIANAAEMVSRVPALTVAIVWPAVIAARYLPVSCTAASRTLARRLPGFCHARYGSITG